MGLLLQARSRVFSCAAFSCTNARPDPWRAFGRNPARSGCHGERDTKLRRSRRVRFCRHPSRPRRTYQVEVLDNGYRFDGKTYPSLTTIAKRITGTHWSGLRFFGLTPKRKA